MTDRPRFHFAFPVHDLAAARGFYGGVLGCPEGRSADHWVDFDLYGHQIVAHLTDARAGAVDQPGGRRRRAGPALRAAPGAGRLADAGRTAAAAPRCEFVIEPHTRFEGEAGEQSTMFVLDPSGNALEFKAFRNDDQIFAR